MPTCCSTQLHSRAGLKVITRMLPLQTLLHPMLLLHELVAVARPDAGLLRLLLCTSSELPLVKDECHLGRPASAAVSPVPVSCTISSSFTLHQASSNPAIRLPANKTSACCQKPDQRRHKAICIEGATQAKKAMCCIADASPIHIYWQNTTVTEA